MLAYKRHPTTWYFVDIFLQDEGAFEQLCDIIKKEKILMGEMESVSIRSTGWDVSIPCAPRWDWLGNTLREATYYEKLHGDLHLMEEDDA